MDNKRKRSCNFTENEINHLLVIANNHKYIIENKETDTNTSKLKFGKWGIIEGEFNAVSGQVFRSSDVLKKKYENLKKNTKKKFADSKCASLRTGGGSAEKVEISSIDTLVLDIVGSERIIGPTSHYDDDTTTTSNSEDVLSCNELLQNKIGTVTLPENEDVKCTAASSATDLDWGNYTPRMLKQPVTEALITRHRSQKDSTGKMVTSATFNEKWAKLVEKKNDILDLQKKFLHQQMEMVNQQRQLMLVEHEQKMAYMAELHELDLLKRKN